MTTDHRRVAELCLARPLRPFEEVHHLNHQRADNRPENLVVLPANAHRQVHRILARGLALDPDSPGWKVKRAVWEARRAQEDLWQAMACSTRVGIEAMALWRIGRRARALPQVQEQQRREWARLRPPITLPQPRAAHHNERARKEAAA